MQDIIEGDDIPLCRLLTIALHASAVLLVSSLIPHFLSQDESF